MKKYAVGLMMLGVASLSYAQNADQSIFVRHVVDDTVKHAHAKALSDSDINHLVTGAKDQLGLLIGVTFQADGKAVPQPIRTPAQLAAFVSQKLEANQSRVVLSFVHPEDQEPMIRRLYLASRAAEFGAVQNKGLYEVDVTVDVDNFPSLTAPEEYPAHHLDVVDRYYFPDYPHANNYFVHAWDDRPWYS